MKQKEKVLFICGSEPQTAQMHEIAKQLGDYDYYFTPYYGDEFEGWLVQSAVGNGTLDGQKERARCLKYLNRQGLPVDISGSIEDYKLVVTFADLTVQRSTPRVPVVLLQERFICRDPSFFSPVSWINALRHWQSKTIRANTEDQYDRLCVASEWYKDRYIRNGADPNRIVVTGVPGFDDYGFPNRRADGKAAQNIAQICRELLKSHPTVEVAHDYQCSFQSRPLFYSA